jgi:Receptor family ligand binding region
MLLGIYTTIYFCLYMVILLFAIIFKQAHSLGLSILVFCSELTPENLKIAVKSQITDSMHTIHFVSVSYQIDILYDDYQEINLGIDLTSSIIYNNMVSDYCKTNKIPVLHLDSSTFVPQPWRFCVHTSFKNQLSALSSLIDSFTWEKVALLSTKDYTDKDFDSQKFLFFENKYYLPVDLNQSNFDFFIGRVIKASGFKQLVVNGPGDFVDKIVSAVNNSLMYSYSGVVIMTQGIWCRNFEKVLIVVEIGLEKTVSSTDYDVTATLNFITYISEYINSKSSYSKDGLLSYLTTITENNYKKADFSIVNIINSEKKVIGTIKNNVVSINQSVLFPSGVPDNSAVKIPISINYNNPVGFPRATSVQFLQSGAILAASIINLSTSNLPNHELSLLYTSCGSEFFIEQLSYYCWSQNISSLGYYYISSIVQEVAIGEMSIFNTLNSKIPNIGGIITYSRLSNSTLYPMFVRVVTTVSTEAYLTNFFNSFQWHQFVVIYTNTTTWASIYEGVVNIVGSNLKNDPSKRMLPGGYNSSMFNDYKYVFQEIYDKGVRVAFVLADYPDIFYIAEGLYDIGLRKGDLLALSTNLLSSYVNGLPDGEFKDKVVEILYGTLSSAGEEWIGEYGKAVKSEFIAQFGEPTENRCYSFDAMMLGVNALEYMVDRGVLYEDSELLIKAIRSQRFTGCSGTVNIMHNSNDRNGYLLGVYNLIFDKNSGTYIDKNIGRYYQDSVESLLFTSDIVWSDGTTVVPSDSRLTGLICPFENRKVQISYSGTLLLYVLLGIFFYIL